MPTETVRENSVAKETIGFIGVGRMGQPMASRLIAAGHPVVAYDIQGQALSAIAVKGAETASSPAEVASRAEIVMASLPMPAVVQEDAHARTRGHPALAERDLLHHRGHRQARHDDLRA